MITEWSLNLAAALGILVLSIPIWRLNSDKKRLQRLRSALQIEDQSDFRAEVGKIAQQKQSEEVASWKWWHEACLWIGYGLLLGSALLRLAL